MFCVPETSVHDQLPGYLENGKFSDVILEVGGTEIKSHKMILSAQSPVFSAMFNHETMKETTENRVVIQDVDAEVAQQMLEFIYTNKMPRKIDEFADRLMVVAQKYQMEKLKLMCARVLAGRLSLENIFSTLIYVDMSEAGKLKEYIFEFIKKNKAIFESTDFKNFENSHSKLAVEIYRNVWLCKDEEIYTSNQQIIQTQRKLSINKRRLISRDNNYTTRFKRIRTVTSTL